MQPLLLTISTSLIAITTSIMSIETKRNHTEIINKLNKISASIEEIKRKHKDN